MIVDCHTHWGVVWDQRDHGDVSKWLACLDRHGVDQAVLMGHAGLCRMDLCRADNETLARLAARYPGRFLPVGTAWPQAGEEGIEEVRHALDDLGMRGLKFHPWLQGFSTADAVLGRMCEMAGERGAPVFFHDGTPCYSLSEQVGGLAGRYPATRFVLAHAGLLWSWRSALQAARRDNVWICLCGPHARAIEILCRRVDPDRIVWGSDFGFGLADQVEYRLNLFRRAAVSDELRERILGANPLRLFGNR